MISYQVLLKQIKEENFAPLYLFCGEEKYIQEELVERLAVSYLGPDADFGREKVDGSEYCVEDVLTRLGESGLFSRRRMLVVDAPPYLAPPRKKEENEISAEPKERDSSEEQSARLLSGYLERQAPGIPENILIFLTPGADRRKRLFKLIDKKGVAVECNPLQGEALVAWIRKTAERLGKKIDRAAVERLLLSGDQNLHYLSQELKKYCAYLGEEDTITADTVERLFSGDLQGNVFRLADSLAEGNLARAQDYLTVLLGRREQPLLIFFMLVRHYRLLLQAHSLLEEGREGAGLASALGVQPFVARKLKDQASLYSRFILEEAIVALQEADHQIKTGCLEPAQALKLILNRIDHVQKTLGNSVP